MAQPTQRRALTGRWKIRNEWSESQAALLRTMGRPRWQVNVIDQAQEDFFLVVYDTDHVHKDVTISLNSTLLRMTNTDRVHYMHDLRMNNQWHSHPDDEKGFGRCRSRGHWDDQQHQYHLDWELHNGRLRVIHYVDERDRLHCMLTFTHNNGRRASSRKVYQRVVYTPAQQAYLATRENRTR